METQPVKIKALIIAHFDTSEVTDEFVGEAGLYLREYCREGEKYILRNGKALYVNSATGVAVGITGSGKVNTSAYAVAVLSDGRFDFSRCYILGTGCAGGSYGYANIGDVAVLTSAVDRDLGHEADRRDMGNGKADVIWYHDASYDDVCCKILNRSLCEKVYERVKGIKLRSTQNTKSAMSRNFPNEEWANREPKVIMGTAVSGDNFWKGKIGHVKADYIARYYGCPHPYAVTEMEDIALAVVAEQFGMLGRLILIRVAVNVDVFMDGELPESLWGGDYTYNEAVRHDNAETIDVFNVAMHNVFDVGKAIIDAALNGTLEE